MRGPVATGTAAVRARSSKGGASSASPSCWRVTPSAWQRRPGPAQSSLRSSSPRRPRIRSVPSVGSSARSSTAAARPSSSQTRLRHQWIPYERYTYAWPGGPNIDALRGVGPRNPWLAGSSPSYASTSTIVPPTPSTSSVAPSRSGATTCTLRAKKSRPRLTSRLEELLRVDRAAGGLEQLARAPAQVGQVDAALLGILREPLGERERLVEQRRSSSGV